MVAHNCLSCVLLLVHHASGLTTFPLSRAVTATSHPQLRTHFFMPLSARPRSTLSATAKSSDGGAKRGGNNAAQPEATTEGAIVTVLLLALWYGLSIINNHTTKTLVAALGAEVLTLIQFVISAACGALVLRLTPQAVGTARLGFTSSAQLFDTACLAAAFLAGAASLNACLAMMHVSLAMVLRAAEPLTTLLLSALMLPASEQPSRAKAAALLPVVLGCALSALGAHGPSARALLLASCSNVCFSLRAILGKRVTRKHGAGAVRLFFQMCVLGAGMQTALLVASAAARGSMNVVPPLATITRTPLTLLLCGVSFFGQLQLSFVCLGRMSAVSHSLANSMRRPATIAAAVLIAPAPLTPLNWAGVGVACAGALLYGLL